MQVTNLSSFHLSHWSARFAVETISLTSEGIQMMATSWNVNDRGENCMDTVVLQNENITNCINQEVQSLFFFLPALLKQFCSISNHILHNMPIYNNFSAKRW